MCPAVKKLEDRAFMAPKPEPPEPMSRIEDFDWQQLVQHSLIVPKQLVNRMVDVDASKFVAQAILNMIRAARGVVRTEPEKPVENWYAITIRAKGKAQLKFQGDKQTVTPYYPVQSVVDRKYVPLPQNERDVRAVHIYRTEDNVPLMVEIPTRLWNEMQRMRVYFQLSLKDFICQALENELLILEAERSKSSTNPNTARLSASAQRWQSKSDKQAERTAEMIAMRAVRQEKANQEGK